MYEVTASDKVFKRGDVGRNLRLGFYPESWRSKTLYPENAFISMHGKVYQSTTGGMSGADWKDDKQNAFVKDGGVVWKIVASNHSILPSSQESQKGSSKVVAGPLPPYYVWGVIKEFYNANKESYYSSPPLFFLFAS